MSVLLDVNGQQFAYPEVNDLDWGVAATDWATAVTNGMLQKAGGLFLLLDDVNFGPNFGLKSIYYQSRSTQASATGTLRLSNTEFIGWRNFADDGDLELSVNTSNQLVFDNGVISQPIQTGITVIDTASIDLTLTGTGDLSADVKALSLTDAYISASAAIAYSKLALTGSIVNADVSASAAIARSKLASGTNYRLLANNSSGVMSENAALTATHVPYADANGQLAGEAAFTYNSTSDTLTVTNLSSTNVTGTTVTGTTVVATDTVTNGHVNFAQTVNTTTTGASAQLTPITSMNMKVTNASLTSLNRIIIPGIAPQGRHLLLTNGTGNSINIVNGFAGTSGIVTGTGADIAMANGASLYFYYDDDGTKWRVVGGSGGGGSSPSIGGTITGGTDNAVLFVDPAATIAQDASFFTYDNATHKLTLGAAPIFSSLTTAGILHNAVTTGQVSSSLLVDADVSSSAAIARTKIASGTNYRILANSATGVMSENAALTAGRVVYPDANGQLTGEAAFAYNALTDTLSVVNVTGSGQFTNPGTLQSEQFGAGASATGGQSVAIGNSATAPGIDNISIGFNSFSAADGASIAIGANCSIASAIASVGIGDSVSVSGDFATVIGAQAQGTTGNSTAVGFQANAAQSSVAIGYGTLSLDGGTSIGTSSSASFSGVAVGNGATGTDSGISIGSGANASGVSSAAIGVGALSSGETSVALGTGAHSGGLNSLALGVSSSSGYESAIAINGSANAPYQMVVGAPTTPITSVFLGTGVIAATTQPVTLTLTGQTTSNTSASDFTIAAPRSVGNATPAGLIFQAGTVGASGSTPQTLTTVARIDQNGLTLSKQALQLNPYTTGAGNTSEIRFVELVANGTNYVGFKAPDAVTANKIFKLPDGDGSANQVLKTDGSLQLGWATVATNPMSNAGEMIYGGVAGAPTAVTAGSSGNLLMSNGTSAPTFTNTVTGVKTFSGLVTHSGGIITGTGGTANSTSDSNLGTIATVTQTAYYEGSFSLTFTGPFTSNQTVTVGYTKIGKQVTLKVPTVVAAASIAAGSITTTGSIPSGLRPIATVGSASLPIKNNGADSATPGAWRVQSGGTIDVYRDWTGPNWTAASTCGWPTDITITYFVS